MFLVLPIKHWLVLDVGGQDQLKMNEKQHITFKKDRFKYEKREV